ncbi:MAG TPA: ABC transporter permease [Chitinophagales bacterium]|nr:ABC transporter permease [Chitinophagales bacterium]
MTRFIAARLLQGFLVMLGVSVLVFFLFQLVRFNPAYALAGEAASTETVANISRELGLDRPVGAQLLTHLNNLSPLSRHALDPAARNYLEPGSVKAITIMSSSSHRWVLKYPYLGRSFQSGRPVASLLNATIPNTLLLALTAMMFATFCGIILGMLAAMQQGSWLDRSITAGSVMGIALPSFFAAILLQLIFAYLLSSFTGLKMTGNLYEADEYTGQIYLSLRNLILPAIALGIRPVAVITQITRSSMLDVLHADYIRTARAKGLGSGAVVYRHALKNALIPVITSVTGWLASLLAGAFFIEVVFNFNGLGLETVNAIKTKDIPVATGAVLYIALVFVLVNMLTDILYGLADPRVKMSSKQAS